MHSQILLPNLKKINVNIQYIVLYTRYMHIIEIQIFKNLVKYCFRFSISREKILPCPYTPELF